MFLNTIDDLLDFFLAQVSCGGHFAESCPDCPQGNGASWCNGDCKWLSGQCIDGNFNSLVGDVMMGPTILAVFLMEVIVVELMSTQYIVLIVYATHMIPVMVHLT